MEQRILFWIFVTIFSATAIITFLGITNVLKINKNYLTAMFSALILEVVAAVILVFQSFDFSAPKATDLNEIIDEAGITAGLEPRQTPESFIIAKLKESDQVPQLSTEIDQLSNNLDSLMEVLRNCEGHSEIIQGNLDELEKTFYIKIKRLRDEINQYDGVINLAYRENTKEDVYQLLIDIYTALGMVSDATPIYNDAGRQQINFGTVRNMHKKFKLDHNVRIDNDRFLYVTEHDTILMIEEYLAIISPVNS